MIPEADQKKKKSHKEPKSVVETVNLSSQSKPPSPHKNIYKYSTSKLLVWVKKVFQSLSKQCERMDGNIPAKGSWGTD